MFILKVTKNGQIQQSDFSTRAECEAHFEKYRTEGYWGKEEYSISHDEIPAIIGIPAQAEIPAVLDINGVEISPAIPAVAEVIAVAAIPAHVEVVPCEYTKKIIDNTAQAAQEVTNASALKYLLETDWYVLRMMDVGTPLPDEMHVLRQQARDRIVR